MITETLIKQFFEGKCDARDRALVQAWLDKNPASLKEYLGLEEWDRFQTARVLSPELSGKLWKNIHNNMGSPAVRFPRFRWMAVAASLLSVVALSWYFVSKKHIATTVEATKDIANHTAQKMPLTLSDGSTVELSTGSTLSYPETFDSSKRGVRLKGEATFNIAKDAVKPFYVYSDAVLITVLGTSFTVTSDDADHATKVVLHEGRIMVRTSDSSVFYLIPGDIFMVKGRKGPGRVFPLEKDQADRYVFDNYPLEVVFDQLQIIYHVKIVYDKAELGNRTFIGKIDKKDPLINLLKSIALLNNFALQQQGNGFLMARGSNLH